MVAHRRPAGIAVDLGRHPVADGDLPGGDLPVVGERVALLLHVAVTWIIPLVDRTIYPEAQYPAGQWDYMLFYEESFEKACAAFDADRRNTVKALFRKGSPSGKGKPSRTAQTRKDGGWFGGTGRAPDVPMDADVVTA